jgi:hypothetical protein
MEIGREKMFDMRNSVRFAFVSMALATTGTVVPAAAQPAGSSAPADQMKVITDPAEVAAILAKCGIRRPAPGTPVVMPKDGAGGTTQVRTMQCDLSAKPAEPVKPK